MEKCMIKNGYIVEFYEYFEIKEAIFIVYEYCPTNLKQIVEQK